MKYISARGQSPAVTFRETVERGLAPDGGLYVPELTPRLPASLLADPATLTLDTVGTHVCSRFIEEIPTDDLHTIVTHAWDFPIPLVQLERGIFLLELFHGPTLAFKDVGARFMAHTLSYFLGRQQRKLTILVATSGDTGSAVAHGFFNVPNITVFILYPSGRISRLQEQQMTTLGGNIRALEVEGSFDDCQELVKLVLTDADVARQCNLTTANSINLGRLLPQICYYVWGVAQWKREFAGVDEEPVVVVPSGNFGNLTAAAYAKAMGTPIRHLVAATNANTVFPKYLQTGTLTSQQSIHTLSNAMDVGNPGNIVRLQALYHHDLDAMRRDISAMSITDSQTLDEIRRTHTMTGYLLDPHTAVAVAVARAMLAQRTISRPVIVTATAHPAKFHNIVKEATGHDVPIPASLEQALHRRKVTTSMKAQYEEFRKVLMEGS
jgi:threonine synthase